MSSKLYGYFSFGFALDSDPCDDNDCEGCQLCGRISIFKISLDSNTSELSNLLRSGDFHECKTSTLEDKYGVHDWSSTVGEIVGYQTYEVPADQIDELMGKWMDVFRDMGMTVFDYEPYITEDDLNTRLESMPAECIAACESLV